MPSAKCLVAIETMPGMMISSEIAKKMLRRPMTFRRRTRGSAEGAGAGAAAGSDSDAPSATMSAFCSFALTSDSSDTIYSEQRRSPEPARGQHDRQQVVGDDDR